MIDSNVMPVSSATWFSCSRIPDMSCASGMALTSRKRFATRIGFWCFAALSAGDWPEAEGMFGPKP